MESFEDFGLKIDNQSCLNEYMKVSENKRSRSFSDPRISWNDNFKHVFTKPVVTEFHVEPPEEEETKICSDHSGHMTSMATTPIYGKNL